MQERNERATESVSYRVNIERIEEEACAENNIFHGITIPVADVDPILGQTLRDPRVEDRYLYKLSMKPVASSSRMKLSS